MSTLSLNVKYRPPRIGWCVRQGNLADFDKAIRLTHTLWGGKFNPILPIEDIELAKRLINAFAVDALYSVEDLPELTAFVTDFPHLRWPSMHEGFYIGKKANLLDIYHPTRQLSEEEIETGRTPNLRAFLYDWQPNDPLNYVLLATVGSYPKHSDKSELYLKYELLLERHIGLNRLPLGLSEPLPVEIYQAITPNVITSLKLEKEYARGAFSQEPGFYIGDASDFEDLVNFWNLRAAGIELAFHDPKYSERLNLTKNYLLENVRNRRDVREVDGKPRFDLPVWYKRPHDEVETDTFGPNVLHHRVHEVSWNGPDIKPPNVHFGNKSVLGALAQTDEGLSVTFQLPHKPFFSNQDVHTQHLFVSVNPVTDIWQPENMTFQAPYIPEMNRVFGSQFHFMSTNVRVEKRFLGTSLGIVKRVRDTQETLRATSNLKLVQTVFENFGIKAEPSQAGLVCARLIQQLGGLQGCRVLKVAGMRKLIREHAPDQSFTRSSALQTIGQIDSNTSKPDFARYEDLVIAKGQRGKLNPNKVFAYLLMKEVFRVGLKFKCENCSLLFWTSLESAKTFTRCEFCGHENNVTPQLKDRDWHYRRSGLFGRNDNQEGSIAVATLLQQLLAYLGQGRLTYTTSLNLNPKLDGTGIASCETDFTVLSQDPDGHPQLVIGECKTAGEITEEDVKNLKRVADAIPTSRMRTYIIFAKLTEFSAEEIELCKNANGEYEHRVILLSQRELEPYRMYEWAEQEFQLKDYSFTLQDAVMNTHDIYFDPKRK